MGIVFTYPCLESGSKWIPSPDHAVSMIHSEDDILRYMQSFSNHFLSKMNVCIRILVEQLTALDSVIESCESDIQRANNNIRILGQKQTVLHHIQSDSLSNVIV